MKYDNLANPTQVFRLRYEDLVRDLPAVITSILDFLGLAQLAEFVHEDLKRHETFEAGPMVNGTASDKDDRKERFEAAQKLNSRLTYGTWRYYSTYRDEGIGQNLS
jgi:hypothetical protein